MKFTKRMVALVLVMILAFSVMSVSVMATDPGGRKTGVAFVNAGSLRLRQSPSTKSTTLAYAAKNEVVVVLGKSGAWYHVLYNLQEGYMHSSYLKFYTVENVELGYGVVNETKVNMRKGPSTSYSAIGQSSKGDPAYIIGINKQWYKVIWNNRICYMRSDYLDLTEVPYENNASVYSPLFYRLGKSIGTKVSADTLKNSENYIGNRNPNTNAKADAIIATAKTCLGVPYVWGGESMSGFDCSGLVQYVYAKHGISLGRTVSRQYEAGTYVSKSKLQPGDLVFFQNTYKTGLSHVGIYIGDGEFIHSSSSNGVMISKLSNSYWSQHYYGACRVL